MNLLINLINSFLDFLVMLNYVVYRYYDRKERNKDARVTSILLSSLFLHLFFWGLLCLFSIFSRAVSDAIMSLEYLCLTPMFLMAVLDYLIVYKSGRHKELFHEIDMISDTEEFKRRKLNVKIFIYTVVIVNVVLLFIVDYFNHHGYPDW